MAKQYPIAVPAGRVLVKRALWAGPCYLPEFDAQVQPGEFFHLPAEEAAARGDWERVPWPPQPAAEPVTAEATAVETRLVKTSSKRE